jgi:hypothetical protein
MKNGKNKIILLLCVIVFLLHIELKCQSIGNQESLIQIQRITSFLINNPPPQYIVEIKDDFTIHFYNHVSGDFSQHQAELLKDWIVDSMTIIIESIDFIHLEETIFSIELKNINHSTKNKSENEIESFNSGGPINNYIIETSNQTIKFSIGANNENDLSNSIKTIRNLFEQLEEKYKPVR